LDIAPLQQTRTASKPRAKAKKGGTSPLKKEKKTKKTDK